MNTDSNFARCLLHGRMMFRNPSRFAFYAGGICREFKEATPFALLVGGTALFFFGISLVNSFFQY
jgi:hypothetical protein